MDEKRLSERESELGTEEAKMIPTLNVALAHKNCVHHFSPRCLACSKRAVSSFIISVIKVEAVTMAVMGMLMVCYLAVSACYCVSEAEKPEMNPFGLRLQNTETENTAGEQQRWCQTAEEPFRLLLQ